LPPCCQSKGQVKEGGGGWGSAYRIKTSQNMVIRCEVQVELTDLGASSEGTLRARTLGKGFELEAKTTKQLVIS
jgi:hypothetical protein